jgi:hypothetical protein
VDRVSHRSFDPRLTAQEGLPGLIILDKGIPVERPGRKAKDHDGCPSVWQPGCRRNVVDRETRTASKKLGFVAAPQAVAGLQKQAPHVMNPDLLCHIGALPVRKAGSPPHLEVL